AIYENDRIVIYSERERHTVLYLDEVTFIPKSEKYMKEALVALCLCLFVNGFNEIDIRQAVRSIPANLFE
ncbi:MAG TPA: hypothetical protein PLP65_08375, partial [Bacteroidales bacterium]|nr:hypothetical protein [Bacteroidales bacterium]